MNKGNFLINWNKRKNKRNEIISFLFLLLTTNLLLTCCEYIEVKPYQHQEKDSVLLNVPVFNSDYGCTVVAIAMLMEYYQTKGYTLIDSEDDIISKEHMEYYAYPMDSRNMLISDSSVNKNPPQNCLADFLKTSWYSEECWYKATEHYNIIPGIRKYLEFKGGKYTLEFSSFDNYGDYMKAIDNGFPVYLATCKGLDIHSCLGIGYVRSDSAFITHGKDFEIVKHPWNINDPSRLRIVGILDLKIKRK